MPLTSSCRASAGSPTPSLPSLAAKQDRAVASELPEAIGPALSIWLTTVRRLYSARHAQKTKHAIIASSQARGLAGYRSCPCRQHDHSWSRRRRFPWSLEAVSPEQPAAVRLRLYLLQAAERQGLFGMARCDAFVTWTLEEVDTGRSSSIQIVGLFQRLAPGTAACDRKEQLAMLSPRAVQRGNSCPGRRSITLTGEQRQAVRRRQPRDVNAPMRE